MLCVVSFFKGGVLVGSGGGWLNIFYVRWKVIKVKMVILIDLCRVYSLNFCGEVFMLCM